MKSQENLPFSDELAQRKGDHIELANRARTSVVQVDERFNYEPMFFRHPKSNDKWEVKFLSHVLDLPLWVSSMTGGTGLAKKINHNLARLTGEFKLGMGLGSCRCLLESDERLDDFKVRRFLGDQPLFANIGIAQVEALINESKLDLLHEVVKKVEATGLMVHVNPLQEWFQPEGDRFTKTPLETLKIFLDQATYPVMVKEVGQGFGPRSLKALLELPLAGIELGAFGGTNFTLLEKLRGKNLSEREGFVNVGHGAREMVEILNALPIGKKEFILSGGISDVLTGFELKSRFKGPSVIGMASAFLEPASVDYETLKAFFLGLRESLLTAKTLLEVKE